MNAIKAWLARRRGKSAAFDAGQEFCRQIGGRVVADETANGIRTVTYRLPDGRKWLFASPSE